jgi:hypothetical protein
MRSLGELRRGIEGWGEERIRGRGRGGGRRGKFSGRVVAASGVKYLSWEARTAREKSAESGGGVNSGPSKTPT